METEIIRASFEIDRLLAIWLIVWILIGATSVILLLMKFWSIMGQAMPFTWKK